MAEDQARHFAGGARRMGRSEAIVSRMGYGAMELAGPPRARALTENEAVSFLHKAIDLGVTYFDTSIDYGQSEQLIGKALQGRREHIVLASKCACQVGVEGPHEGGEKHIYTAQNVIAGVEQSLKRMRTDYLDVVQVHGDPTLKELEEGGVISALESLRKRGLVRLIGISSRLPKLAEFVDLGAFDMAQVPYSALQRQNENVIEALKKAGKAVVARGVTGRGAPAKNWATRPIGTEDGEARDLWARARLDEILDGMPRMEFMIRFALANPNVDVALVATTDVAHLAADVSYADKGALDLALYKAACDRLDQAGGGAGQGKYARGGPSPVV